MSDVALIYVLTDLQTSGRPFANLSLALSLHFCYNSQQLTVSQIEVRNRRHLCHSFPSLPNYLPRWG